MEKQQRIRLLKKILDGESLPSLSPLTVRLIELATDESSSAKDLASMIEKDPGLTTRLLKMVGSIFFSRSEPVHSINQAVVVLGFKRLRIMALTLSLRDTFPMGKCGGMDYDLFWKTSLYRALISQEFAEASGHPDIHPDESFLGGLILEIGMLLLYDVCPDEIKDDFPGGQNPLDEIISWEENHLGMNHRELGGLILKRWRFSDRLVDAQKNFGVKVFENNGSPMVKILELARRGTEAVFCQASDLCRVHRLAGDLLAMDQEDVNTLLSEAFDRVAEMASQLRMEANAGKDILLVMERANQALGRINQTMEKSLDGIMGYLDRQDRATDETDTGMSKSRHEIFQNTLDAVAHEIRNPLSAIGGFARRLATQAEEGDKGREYARIIAEESARLERILKEIEQYAQSYEPLPSEVDLIALMEDILHELEGQFLEKEILLIRNFPKGGVTLFLEREGIRKALTLLLKTAMDRVVPGSGKIVLSVDRAASERPWCITLSDNGKPVSDEIKDVLMDCNLSTKTFGEGLGLPLARKIIEAHKGRISLDGEAVSGNRVDITLPG